MSKTKTYKTLKGLLNQSYGQQISLYSYKAGRFHHKKLGWINFKLSSEATKELLQGFSEITNCYPYQLVNCSLCGLLERLTLTKYGFQYVAGQDYTCELRYLRKWIRTK